MGHNLSEKKSAIVREPLVQIVIQACVCLWISLEEPEIKFIFVAWWLRHCATNRKVASSIPEEVNF
jgi:hypothetical protein